MEQANDIGWCPFAVKRPISVNFGGEAITAKAIVLHVAAGPLAAIFPTFDNPNTKASAHFGIGKDGTIEQYVSILNTAWGNGLSWNNGTWFNPRGVSVMPTWTGLVPGKNPNGYTVSVEHEGQPEDTWTYAMSDANTKLLAWLCDELKIEPTTDTVIGHCAIDPVDRPNCPGPNVNYADIAEKVEVIRMTSAVQWLAINKDAALYKKAQYIGYGSPQTGEIKYQYNGALWIAQVYEYGIVYCKYGDWDNIKWTSKV